MTAVCETFGVARSNMAERVRQRPSKARGRPPFADDDLVDEIKAVIFGSPLVNEAVLNNARGCRLPLGTGSAGFGVRWICLLSSKSPRRASVVIWQTVAHVFLRVGWSAFVGFQHEDILFSSRF